MVQKSIALCAAAEGRGLINGGLINFSPPSWANGNVYNGSGFTDSGGPQHLPGHTTADLSLAKNFGEGTSVALTALNLANRRFLLDNSLTFGGTHFFNPREIFVEL